MYDECGNKCSTPGEQAAKRYVPPIERNESSSLDVVIKEMVGDDTRWKFHWQFDEPNFRLRQYQTFFGSIVRYLRKRNT